MKRIAIVILVVGFIAVGLFVSLVLVSNRTEEARHWGYIDASGEVVIPVSYDDADDFSHGLAAVSVAGSWGFVRTDGDMAVPPSFMRVGRFTADGVAWAEDTGQAVDNNAVGYIDTSGNWVIPPRFDIATGFENGVATAGLVVGLTTTRISGSTSSRIYSFGITDREGRWIVEPLDDSEPWYWSSAGHFADGLAPVRVGQGDYGYADHRGAFITDSIFEQAQGFHDGVALTRTAEGAYRVIDATGASRLEVNVSGAILGDDGYLSLQGTLGEEEGWFLADLSGAIHTGPFESMGAWSEGRVPARIDGLWYLIDAVGSRYGAGWDAMETASEGLAAVGRSGEGFFADYEWGFIDLDGNVAIEPAWNRVGPFVEGRARVARLEEQ